MQKKRIKVKAVPLFIFILFIIPIVTIALLLKMNLSNIDEEVDYVTESDTEETLPVVNADKKIIFPYTDQSVKVAKTYYDYKGEEESQLNSITVHDNTYLQNAGIDYTLENVFDVVAVLEGSVINVVDDEVVGKSVEIKHDNGYVTMYQSLSEVTVKKGDTVNQGQVIGKSGTNEMEKDMGNHLHFEIYNNGQSLNPADYLDKELKVN